MRLSVGALLCACVAVVKGKVYLEETFERDTLGSKWMTPKTPMLNKEGDEVPLGKWVIEDGVLKTMDESRFYELSRKFDTPFTNEDKELIVQFTVRHGQGIDCGGGYIKLLPKGFDQDTFGGETPYLLMFGPDICGTTRKLHIIWSYKGENHETTRQLTVPQDKIVHLYTLRVKPDNGYEVYVDNERAAWGTFVTDWAIIPPPLVPNVNAVKPEDWVDEKEIDDESDEKPEDWEANRNDNEELPFVYDTTVAAPIGWDRTIDGPWKGQKVKNPKYRGEWKPKRIPNPAYKGPWMVPKIKNPDRFIDDKIYILKDIAGVGFDLWQVKAGSEFDNILITDDWEYAQEMASKEWEGEWKEQKERMEEEKAKRKKEMEEQIALQDGLKSGESLVESGKENKVNNESRERINNESNEESEAEEDESDRDEL